MSNGLKKVIPHLIGAAQYPEFFMICLFMLFFPSSTNRYKNEKAYTRKNITVFDMAQQG